MTVSGKALNEIKATIGYLQNQVKTVLRDSPDQKERQKRFSEVVQRRPKSYHIFAATLGKLSEVERRSIRFGTYHLLWDYFPARLDLEGNVGNADDPGDGKVYDARSIEEVQLLLKAFYEAWSEATIRTNQVSPTTPDTIRQVGKIPEMAKICLILRGMKQERLLDCFCEDSKDDKHLPFKAENLKLIFDHDDAFHAETFCTEQYRAISRTWNDGEHIKVADAEPFPLIFINEYGKGSYGSVRKHRHAFTNVFYACKEQISVEARAHLLREIARLKKLGHRHIVQFVKSYQRGDRYGILLKPAATTDLKKLLDRYRRNGFDYDKNAGDRRRDRTVLKSVLLTAFGCLSQGLAHIHGCKIRHKDIKPANILYEKALSPNPARFLWADFGLAHDFGNTGNSKTVSRNRQRYSPRYAAPEIMEEFEARKARGEIGYESSDNDDEEDAPVHTPEGLNGNQESIKGHGRSSDIYSFGIVFLEILSYLIAEGPEASIPRDFESFEPFWKNIEDLQTWAHQQIQCLPPEDPSVYLFRLASKMIAHEAVDRPVISTIVNDLTRASAKYFCTPCLKDSHEPISQAVIAEEQMVEGLDNAKFLTERLYHVKSHGSSSVQEVEHVQQSGDESDAKARRRHSRASVYSGEKQPTVTRSLMRSPSRRRDRPPSILRFGVPDEIIPETIPEVSVNMMPLTVEDWPHMPSTPPNTP